MRTPKPTEGLVLINIELNNPSKSKNRNRYSDIVSSDYTKNIFLPANSAREIGLVFSSQPERLAIKTYVSKNLPNDLVFDFPEFNATRKVPVFDTIQNCDVFTSITGNNEIVVDNEDAGFKVNKVENEAFLKSLIHKNTDSKNDYSPMRFWNPPQKWVAVLDAQVSGNYVHSARYVKAGDGKLKATWIAHLKKKGLYDVSFYLNKYGIGRNKSTDYNFNVYRDGGVEKISVIADDLEEGWNTLGSFSFSMDSAKVELTNKSSGRLIIADAIKWQPQ